MTPLRLAEFEVADQQGFADLVNEVHRDFGFSFDPQLDADLADPTAFYRQVWVLKHADRVVGSAALTPPVAATTTLKRMYLRPAYRGQGWGRRLLRAAIDAAMSWSCRRIELDTSDRQPAARRLYETAGFELARSVGSTRYYVKQLRPPLP